MYLVLLLPGEARVKLVGHGVEAEIEAARKDLVELRAGATKQRRRMNEDEEDEVHVTSSQS